MSPDQYAELEALKQDSAYDDWISNVTDPESHRTTITEAEYIANAREELGWPKLTKTCRMCGKSCPPGYMRGNVCVDCETMSGELLDPKLK